MKSPANFCQMLHMFFCSIGHTNNQLMKWENDHYAVFLSYFNKSKIRWDLLTIRKNSKILEPNYFNLLKGFMEIFQIKANEYGLPTDKKIIIRFYKTQTEKNDYVIVTLYLNLEDGWSYSIVN